MADWSGPVRATSKDGTDIAYWFLGAGPPLVMVHGVSADHTRWQPVLPYLEPHATVFAIDRRGRGASGDGPEYSLGRESEDVAAVVDAVAPSAGTAVDLYGHSYGGLCAFGAVSVTSKVRRLVLYEGWPSVDPTSHGLPPGVGERLDELLAADDRDSVIETLFRTYGSTDEEIAGLRAQPAWQARMSAAHTITRELQANTEALLDRSQASKISVPTLLRTGEKSPDPSVADIPTLSESLPNARVEVIAGQSHLADVLAPSLSPTT